MPLSRFVLSGSEGIEVTQANAILVSDCMAKSGYDYPRALEDWAAKPVPQDRRYGLWSETAAINFGYDYPEDAGARKIDAIEANRPEDWWNQTFICIEESDQLPLLTMDGDTVAGRGQIEAHEALLASDTYSKARDAWVDCMRDAGIAADDNENLLLPVLPPSKEEQARIAAIDVGCKADLGTVQQIAEFEARHQQKFVDAHEAELVKLREEAESVLATAREVIATHG